MWRTQTIDLIDEDAVEAAAARYDGLVSEELKPLDHQRYEVIPATFAKRSNSGGQNEPYITRDELITLMQWKLKHGTFRPRLLDLINPNSDATVCEQSAEAFKALAPITAVEHKELPEERIHLQEQRLEKAFQHLNKLKGVGPTTASLVLSVFDPHNIPFFSDELARWTIASPADWDTHPLAGGGDSDLTKYEERKPHRCWKVVRS